MRLRCFRRRLFLPMVCTFLLVLIGFVPRLLFPFMFLLVLVLVLVLQEAFDAQSFVSRLLGFGDMKGLMQQIQESQEGSGDPKELM